MCVQLPPFTLTFDFEIGWIWHFIHLSLIVGKSFYQFLVKRFVPSFQEQKHFPFSTLFFKKKYSNPISLFIVMKNYISCFWTECQLKQISYE